ncbi:guanine nucleotide exchange factor MSS4 homolog [Wyeomyia smithii]|uniref:guanine nucleotide exchange factor MSS4 homolog n=1 Tax=Wyeomyia smithii TaxID=174621 RepID=UPI0024681F60|nr:guanine nucleotide exchange factor MSS4 homolog [Wyeomyia smithii]XP_055546479.1 guanine nucleotide exchange factor MSS4 homolog [Wyeomyia smithii]XP_055546480.1 guanine nucleotide exchange factor MSS4 homolog [Wyeomyia smithii]
MSTAEEFSPLELISEGKNKTHVKCNHCGSVILKSGTADYVEKEFELPEPYRNHTREGVAEFVCEKFKDFWEVLDMYTFENICFSKTVDNVKYLICADCEIGPVGYQDLQLKRCYIALQRVKHEDT